MIPALLVQLRPIAEDIFTPLQRGGEFIGVSAESQHIHAALACRANGVQIPVRVFCSNGTEAEAGRAKVVTLSF